MRSFLMVALSLPALLFASDGTEFFKSSYDEARSQFKNVSDLQANTPGMNLQQLEFFDPLDSQLKTDVTWLRPIKPNSRLIVVFSGLHGIEGLAGSAIQSRMLMELKPTMKSDYLFVHALNPYGFKNFRRVDRFNIDLNRNFILNKPDFLTPNKAYEKLDSFLNPTHPAQLSFFSRFHFIFLSLQLILQHSLDSVRQSILIGQHQFPKGLYYGGSDHQYQKKIIDTLNTDIFNTYEKIVAVDLHTGYGEKGKLHILVNSKSQTSAKNLTKIFSENRIDFGDQKNFYKVSGDLVSYLESKSSLRRNITAVVFEYGTMNSQKITGSIESLRRMVLENQKFQFGTEKSIAKTLEQEIDFLFLEMFYPKDLAWRQSVLSQTDLEFEKIETFLQE